MQPKQSVLISTPCGHSLVTDYVISLIASLGELRRAGIEATTTFHRQASLITMARNHAARKFLSDTARTDLVFIDSDISWNGPDLVRLLSHDVDVVGGVYRMKKKDVIHNVNRVEGAAVDKRGLVATHHLGAGFLRIRRSALEKLRPSCPDDGFFDQTGTGMAALGEDFSFCKRWIDAGGTVYADTKIKLRHWGMTAYE